MGDGKRLGRRVAVSLLLGAVLNVLMAWGIALVTPCVDPNRNIQGIDMLLQPGRGWFVELNNSLGVSSVMRIATSEPLQDAHRGPRPAYWSGAWESPTAVEATHQITEVAEWAFGVPCRSMRSELTHNTVTGAVLIVSGWQWRADEVPIFAPIPTSPLLPGFLANTAFYSGIVFLLLCIRPALRHMKGRCTRCGYDLRHSAGACPECGAVVRVRTAVARAMTDRRYDGTRQQDQPVDEAGSQ